MVGHYGWVLKIVCVFFSLMMWARKKARLLVFYEICEKPLATG